MEGDVNQTLGELERRLKELEQELEAVGRAGEVDAEPAQAGWTAPPPPGTTPFTATWSGGAQPAPGPPPTPNGAPAIPVRPPYWQPVGPPPATGQEPTIAEPPEPEATAQPPEPSPAAWQHPAAGEPAPAAEPVAAPAPASPAAPSSAPRGTANLHRQLDELLAFRERLVTSTNELVAELSRVLTDLGAEMEAEALEEPDPADTVLSGDVVVEAGPFGDLATLAAFEQAVQRTDGVAAVHVRALNDGHAVIDVTLDEPTRLAAELRERAIVAFEVAEVDEHRLVLAIDASSDAPLG